MRAIVLVMDGVGCGELPDANLYQDAGSNTIAHIADHYTLNIPTLSKLGFTNIIPLKGFKKNEPVIGSYGKMAEFSPGKDSVTGHWEIAGVHLDKAFPVYPNGFPESIINPFIQRTGRGILGNIPASGTQIIEFLGNEHIETGKLIVYTSADSVFQIAAHEDVVSIKELYSYCEIARELLVGEHHVGRVIARPFVGDSQKGFTRTKYRKDYSVQPPSKTVLDIFSENNISTHSVGKIYDLFDGVGISDSYHAKGNRDCMKKTISLLDDVEHGLIMTNLVDFDMLYGHQRDTKGFADELERFDSELTHLVEQLRGDDLLILTADHGNDPTHTGTDHTREYVPLVVYGKTYRSTELGTRQSFADIGKSLAEYFGIKDNPLKGNSFIQELNMAN